MEILTLYFLIALLYNVKKHYGRENMKFCDKLNEYIETLECTAKELSTLSGISTATVSRYRSGERLPDAESEAFPSLINALAGIAESKKLPLVRKKYARSFLPVTDLLWSIRSSCGLISIRLSPCLI